MQAHLKYNSNKLCILFKMYLDLSTHINIAYGYQILYTVFLTINTRKVHEMQIHKYSFSLKVRLTVSLTVSVCALAL